MSDRNYSNAPVSPALPVPPANTQTDFGPMLAELDRAVRSLDIERAADLIRETRRLGAHIR